MQWLFQLIKKHKGKYVKNGIGAPCWRMVWPATHRLYEPKPVGRKTVIETYEFTCSVHGTQTLHNLIEKELLWRSLPKPVPHR